VQPMHMGGSATTGRAKKTRRKGAPHQLQQLPHFNKAKRGVREARKGSARRMAVQDRDLPMGHMSNRRQFQGTGSQPPKKGT